MVKYVSLGIILDDIVFPDGQTQMGVLGGGGPQTVWGMALAAETGQDVGLIAGVGHDFDFACLAPLEAMQIDLSGVYATSLPTPRAWQLLEEDGRRQHVWRVDQATSDRQTHPDHAKIIACYPHLEVIHWGIHPEAPHLAPCTPLHAGGILISIEPFKGLDTPLSEAELAQLLGSCDIYSPTWAEAVSIFGTSDRPTMLRKAAAAGGKLLPLRLGERGAEIWNLETGCGVSVPAVPVDKIVDPVGAGDAFCGAFAVSWHVTGDLTAAAISASVAASYMLEQIGLPTTRPSRENTRQRRDAIASGLRQLRL